METNTKLILERYGLMDAFRENEHFKPLKIHKSRWKELPILFKELGYSCGVEIGVLKGDFTSVLADAGFEVVGIDPWFQYDLSYRDYEDQSFEDIEAKAREKLKGYPNVTLLKAFSAEASESFDDGSLDFVFIDGNHQLEFVIDDLSNWTPKIRKGGMICGHDYKRFGGKNHMDVVDAVNAWVFCRKIAPWFILTKDSCPSFLWIKE